MTNPDYQSSPPPADGRAVGGPAIALLVYGCVLLLGGILGLLFQVLGVGLAAAGGAAKSDLMVNGVVGVASAIFAICFSGVIIFGAMKMKKLQGYGLAMTAAIMAMLPCSVCCIFGLPIGIWALVVLMKPEVKAAFNTPPAGGSPTV